MDNDLRVRTTMAVNHVLDYAPFLSRRYHENGIDLASALTLVWREGLTSLEVSKVSISRFYVVSDAH